MKIYQTIGKFFRRYRNYNENNIDYEEAKIILKNNKYAILLDVRSPQEYKEGHLEGSINIPLYDLERNMEKQLTDKEETIIVYCQSGNRSKKAIDILYKKNYKNLYNIEGGMDNLDQVHIVR